MKLQMPDGTLKPLTCYNCDNEELVLIGGTSIGCFKCNRSKTVTSILKNQKAIRVML